MYIASIILLVLLVLGVINFEKLSGYLATVMYNNWNIFSLIRTILKHTLIFLVTFLSVIGCVFIYALYNKKYTLEKSELDIIIYASTAILALVYAVIIVKHSINKRKT